MTLPINHRAGELGGLLSRDVAWSTLQPECKRSRIELVFHIASARHALADSELALRAYAELKTEDMSEGELYLATYGALHSISMRSEAMQVINDAFREAWGERILRTRQVKDLKKAAQARHHVLAHPFEKRAKGFSTSYTGIFRQSLRIGSFALTKFELMSGEVSREQEHTGEVVEHGSVDITVLVREQTAIILDGLGRAIKVASEQVRRGARE